MALIYKFKTVSVSEANLSLLHEKKSGWHTARRAIGHFQVTSSRNVTSLFVSLGGSNLIRSHVCRPLQPRLALLPLFLVKWFAHTAQCCYQIFFLCNSNVKRLYTVYQQFSYQSTAITQIQNLRPTHLRWSDNMA